MQPPKAWESHWSYRIMRHYVNWLVRTSLLSLKSHGSLPADGAIILCPNHTNTLMDPLVLLPLIHKRIVFGARQDVFKQPVLNWFIRMAGVMPTIAGLASASSMMVWPNTSWYFKGLFSTGAFNWAPVSASK